MLCILSTAMMSYWIRPHAYVCAIYGKMALVNRNCVHCTSYTIESHCFHYKGACAFYLKATKSHNTDVTIDTTYDVSDRPEPLSPLSHNPSFPTCHWWWGQLQDKLPTHYYPVYTSAYFPEQFGTKMAWKCVPFLTGTVSDHLPEVVRNRTVRYDTLTFTPLSDTVLDPTRRSGTDYLA